MVLRNVNTGIGICNGSLATVYDVVLNKDGEVVYILLQMTDEYTGPSLLEHYGIPRIVPIARYTAK